MSKGSAELLRILRSIFGEVFIKEEHVLPGNLRLDFYIPSMSLAFEFHGRQHDHFVQHFHKDIEDFNDAKRRDEQKSLTCHKMGIMLVSFWHNERLTFDLVKDRISEVVRNWEPYYETPVVKPVDEYKETQKVLAREARRRNYERCKEYKKQSSS